MIVKFKGEGGWPFELERARRVFNVDDSYEVVGGTVRNSSSDYIFKGIPGQWNTVMFTGSWQEAVEEGLIEDPFTPKVSWSDIYWISAQVMYDSTLKEWLPFGNDPTKWLGYGVDPAINYELP